MKILERRSILPFALAVAVGAVAEPAPPYPRSDLLAGISFDRQTLQRSAEGSDIWSCAWAGDGHLYAAWGDGGGFGGTDQKGRVSLGVARIIGAPPHWKGINVWGGWKAVSRQKPTEGKATMIAADGGLYLYVSEQGAWNRCRLWKSRNGGRTWTNCGWIFPKSHKAFAFPGLVQFGRDNHLSPEGYVYGLSDNGLRRVHDDRLYLFRVKAGRIEDLAAYQYFAGTEQAPRWSGNIDEMKPVFFNPAGISWGSTCVYDPAVGRFLLAATTHEEQGDWGLFESRHLWGPWRTVAYAEDFPAWTYSPAEKKRPAYLHTFPAKWMGSDGKTLWCVFDRGDHFNLVQCALVLKPGR
ncbi:MAG: DUF4185 domain-containing protein [Verrucomicrobiota bacterium]|nr:DUF4185 domain-containing protein [Verrucomicrobiota bacterium]